MNDWINVALEASMEAGRAIMDIYESDDVGVEYKEDASPLTRADRAAHQVILRHLEPTGIPVLSEEGKHMPFEDRSQWDELWIVDPVDGTKEFIKRNGEFTVNIALVRHGRVAGGVVLPPFSATRTWGWWAKAHGAWTFPQTWTPRGTAACHCLWRLESVHSRWWPAAHTCRQKRRPMWKRPSRFTAK